MGNTPPTDTLRDGNIKASIWENDGEKGPFYTTTFAKTYRDEEGNYRDTNGFNKGDLLRLAELARASYSRTGQLQREAGQDGPSREDLIEELIAQQKAKRNEKEKDLGK